MGRMLYNCEAPGFHFLILKIDKTFFILRRRDQTLETAWDLLMVETSSMPDGDNTPDRPFRVPLK